ncbi:MAG: ribosome silencing factor [Bacteroidota bacterium]|nr:ribosome silencing factor [Bacteroidota bacterium]MDP4231400.1 ribosome silencing factor [Bacteroidota bacterium]
MAKTTTTKKKPTIKKTPAKKPTAAKKPVARKRPVPKQAHETNKLIAHQAALFALEKKATNIKVLDVRNITSFADYFVIASGSSDMQVKAIAENILTKMREIGVTPWKSEGWDALQWVIVDFVDVVVHVFSETAREFYHLERLWADAPMEIVEDKPKARRTAKK